MEPGLSIYVRKGNSYLHSADFELANMEAEKPANGAFGDFLKRYSHHTFLIENVLNERFRGYLLRNGFRKIKSTADEDLAPSFIQHKCRHYRDNV